MEKLDSSRITVEEKEKTKAKLELIMGRNLAHELMNERETKKNAKDLEKVKTYLEEAEKSLTKQHDLPLTKEQAREINDNYMRAITACQMFASNQKNSGKTMAETKSRVAGMLEQLKNEAALFDLGVHLYLTEKPEGVEIRCGADFILYARMYELGKSLKSKKDVKEDGDFNVKKRSLEETKGVFSGKDNVAKDVLAMILTGTITPSMLFNKKVKSPDKLSKREKAIKKSMEQLRDKLSEFSTGEAKVVMLTIGEEAVRLVKHENGHLFLSGTGFIMDMGSIGKVIADLDNDVMKNQGRYYSDADIFHTVKGFPEFVMSMSAGDYSRNRNFLTKLLAKRTKLGTNNFDNLPFTKLRELTMGLLNKTVKLEQVRSAAMQANAEKSEKINTEKEMEIMAIKNLQKNMEVNYQLKYEEKETGWTKEEAQLKDIVSELIYFQDTREMDLSEAEKDPVKAGEKVRDVLLKNVDSIVLLMTQTYVNSLNEKEGKPVTPTVLDNLLDKLPMFMAGDP